MLCRMCGINPMAEDYYRKPTEQMRKMPFRILTPKSAIPFPESTVFSIPFFKALDSL